MTGVIWKSGISKFVSTLDDEWILRLADDFNDIAMYDDYSDDSVWDTDGMSIDEIRRDVIYQFREADKTDIIDSNLMNYQERSYRSADSEFLNKFDDYDGSLKDALREVTRSNEVGKYVIELDDELGHLGIYANGKPLAGFCVYAEDGEVEWFQNFLTEDDDFADMWYQF